MEDKVEKIIQQYLKYADKKTITLDEYLTLRDVAAREARVEGKTPQPQTKKAKEGTSTNAPKREPIRVIKEETHETHKTQEAQEDHVEELNDNDILQMLKAVAE